MKKSLSSQFFDHLYIPAPKPGADEKLVIVFHGLGDSLNGFTFLPQELGLPHLSYFLVNAPDEYFGGFSWYDFMADPEVTNKGVTRSRELIHHLLEELEMQGIKPANMILFGFSQGCLVAMDSGLRYPKTLAGIVGISGYIHRVEEYPTSFSTHVLHQHFLCTHGSQDPVVPFAPAKSQFEKLKSLGVNLEFRPFNKVHTILPNEIKEIAHWLQERMKEK